MTITAVFDRAEALSAERARTMADGTLTAEQFEDRMRNIDERGRMLAAEAGPGWRYQGGLVYSAQWLNGATDEVPSA